jgi:Zn-dependent M28 family amino/carboxypeptidase
MKTPKIKSDPETFRQLNERESMDERLVLIVKNLTAEQKNTFLNPAGLARAADYIEAFFLGLGLKTMRQTYEADGVECHNVEAVGSSFQGRAKPHYILGAHYDSALGAPGADDNISAVAVMLETARGLLATPEVLKHLRFVAYVNEEPPHFSSQAMGSYVHARSCRAAGDNILGMICLESLGYYSNESGSQELPEMPEEMLALSAALMVERGITPDVGNFLALVGDEASQELLMRFDSLFSKGLGVSVMPMVNPEMRLSDQFSYWDVGYPALMLTDTAFFRNPNYHEPSDTFDTLNYCIMARITHNLIEAFQKL